jgi:hypothetical protein
MIFADNATAMTALPRLSLNGNYQERRYLPVLTSGAATAMWNGFNFRTGMTRYEPRRPVPQA